MRRSKSMSPKVEGLESLVFLSVTLPGATAGASVADRGEPIPSPNGPAGVDISAQSGPAEQGEVQLTSAPSNRPISPQANRPINRLTNPPANRLTNPPINRLANPPTARSGLDLANLDLSSTMRGNYRLQIAPDGSSGSFQIQGVGQVRGLGPARISSSYLADANSAPETMTLTINSRRGNLTLQVGRQPGDTDPDEMTARLRYQVVDATGSLAGAAGTGIVDMNLRPQLRTMGATGQSTLTIRPDLA